MNGTMRVLPFVMQGNSREEEIVEQRRSPDVGIVGHREEIAVADKVARSRQ